MDDDMGENGEENVKTHIIDHFREVEEVKFMINSVGDISDDFIAREAGLERLTGECITV